MFCSNCGAPLKGDEAFCPVCGTPVPHAADAGSSAGNVAGNAGQQNGAAAGQSGQYGQYNQGAAAGQSGQYGQYNQGAAGGQSGQGGGYNGGWNNGSGNGNNVKRTLSEYLTPENIERFAPVAAFTPLFMAIVLRVFSSLHDIMPLAPIAALLGIIIILLRIVFVLASGAATAGLIMVALNRKDTSNPWTWVAPAATFLAFLSCFITLFRHRPDALDTVGFLFAVAAFVLGLDLLAKVTIAGKPMETPIQFAEDVQIYRQAYTDYKMRHPEPMKENQGAAADLNGSYFDGSGLEFFGLSLAVNVLGTVTCGIAMPWLICALYKWQMKHTVINGRRLTFTGTGGALFGHWILWLLLSVVTCGIYGFFAYVALRKWEMARTFIDGEPIDGSVQVSYFDGTGIEYLGYGLLAGLMCLLTCFIALPWAACMIQRWDVKHQCINGHRLDFYGTGLGMLGQYIIIFLLSLITCGIYAAWGTVRIFRYMTKNTSFVS